MKHFLTILFMALLMFAQSCNENSDKIIVGFFGSLTGPDSTFGLSSKNGINMAIDEVNQSGGILGKKVELKVYDTLGSIEEVKLIVGRLISVDKAVALLGEVSSTRSLVAAPIAQKLGVPMITPSSTNPRITQFGDYIFRTCFIDAFQGSVMAKFAFNSLKLKNAAVLTDTDSEYSKSLADYFIKTYSELGGKVLIVENYMSGDVDFYQQLQKIQKKKPEFIFVPGYYSEAGLIARQAREVGLSVPLMGGDGWDSENLVAIAGDSINGSYFSNHYTLENQDPEVQSFIREYEKRFKLKPDSQAASGYDAARILFQAIKTAGTTEPDKLRDALAKTTAFKGVTGTISINEHRDAVKSAVVLQIKGNQFRFVESIHP